MIVALVTALLIIVAAYTALVWFLARQVRNAYDGRLKAMEAGEALLKSNFELQAEVHQWKSSHEDALRALVDKSAELDRAVAARKVLEHRHSDLVLRLGEGAPLDTLPEELRADLDKVRALSASPVPPEVSRPLPLPAPPKERDTPVERPKTPLTGK